MSMLLTSPKTLLEMTEPKVRKATAKALLNRAVAAAQSMAKQDAYIMCDYLHCWTSWVTRPAIRPHFLQGNASGITLEDARRIKEAFRSTYQSIRIP